MGSLGWVSVASSLCRCLWKAYFLYFVSLVRSSCQGYSISLTSIYSLDFDWTGPRDDVLRPALEPRVLTRCDRPQVAQLL
ncbi:hypothetical protein P154DRAFT_142950 [Amniculicola lignicola CBS 123094]|uniref:Uncharacterized protein n=1 Tax=Amniculicola lignicola CBS 123094 TaxID=1392246 RepID=A0A6A5WMK5_9PLEO|nr:hypothetical protein P154DRAFT_142950 [Amniculicola lignicola CBS 123094]